MTEEEKQNLRSQSTELRGDMWRFVTSGAGASDDNETRDDISDWVNMSPVSLDNMTRDSNLTARALEFPSRLWQFIRNVQNYARVFISLIWHADTGIYTLYAKASALSRDRGGFYFETLGWGKWEIKIPRALVTEYCRGLPGPRRRGELRKKQCFICDVG